MRARLVLPVFGVALAFSVGAVAGDGWAAGPRMLGLGDSIGSGVQSADANLLTQSQGYLSLIARKAGSFFPLPWVIGGPFSTVGDTTSRQRIFPWLPGRNLGVSGADLNDVLNTRADALFRAAIDSETDLMLFPRRLSQMEIAETVAADLVICWIGANDAMAAVLAFDELNATQMTPVAEFELLYAELADRLAALPAAAVAVANLPDVTTIPFLVDQAALAGITGRDDLTLAAGSKTTLVVAALALLGLEVQDLLDDPDWVLDSAELAVLGARVDAFNQIIAQEAGRVGLPVVDVHGHYADIVAQAPIIGGVATGVSYLGGVFSLDGVHPSNIGHALLANVFIEELNAVYGLGIPLYSAAELAAIVATDPSIDKDGDGLATGRFPFGLLETVAPLIGVSGDIDDTDPTVPAAAGLQAAAMADPTAVGDSDATEQMVFAVFDQMVGRGP